MHGFGGHGWGMGWGWIIGLIIIIAAVWLIVRSINQNKSTTRSHKSSMDILKERYAKGEIDKNEFEQRKKDLM